MKRDIHYIIALLLLMGATTMHAQSIKGKIYGGGELSTVDGDTKVQVNSGTIGDESFNGGVFGGGLGEPTIVTGKVDVLIGKPEAERDASGPTINGDVYGGSALGNTNCSSELVVTADKTTNVTLNAGTINGSMYGGGLGNATNAADVFGPVTVTVKGGSLSSTGHDGSGAVFGCNNINGSPRHTVNVNVAGGLMENVYGGGNMASYSAPDGNKDYPQVLVCNGVVNQSVFGGGLGSTAVVAGNPQVKIGIFPDDVHSTIGHNVLIKESVYGGGSHADVVGYTNVGINSGESSLSEKVKITKDVFGGCMQAAVTEHTNVYIKGSTVEGYVYGGGSQGTVGSARAEDDPKDYTKVIVDQSEVKKDVFGGGYGAEVTGNTAVWIKGIDCFIHGSVLGGGFGGDVTGNTHVQIGARDVDGDGEDDDLYPESLLKGGN